MSFCSNNGKKRSQSNILTFFGNNCKRNKIENDSKSTSVVPTEDKLRAKSTDCDANNKNLEKLADSDLDFGVYIGSGEQVSL